MQVKMCTSQLHKDKENPLPVTRFRINLHRKLNTAGEVIEYRYRCSYCKECESKQRMIDKKKRDLRMLKSQVVGSV